MARPGMGKELIHRQDGDLEAKRRAEICLDTVYGVRSVEDACAELCMSKQAFHDWRDRIIRAAITGATIKAAGRPPKAGPDPDEITAIKAELEREAKRQQILAEGLLVREELTHLIGSRLGEGRLKKMINDFNRDKATAEDGGKKGRPTKA